MSRLRWQAKAAKRELAEDALRRALNRISDAATVGGSAACNGGSTYAAALYLVRHAEKLLSQSEAE